MKRLVFVLAFLSSAAAAQPFVYADTAGTSVATTTCGVYLDTAAKVVVPTVLVGTTVTCKFDVGTVTTGSHTVKLTTIATVDPVWGTQESAQSAPFVFVRPAAPSTPANIRVAP